MKTYLNVKWLVAAILLTLSFSNVLQASYVEIPINWIKNGKQYVANEDLPPYTDGYLDFTWDGTYVYYGFYKNQIHSGSSGLSGGIFLSGSSFYVLNGSWNYLGAIASAGDRIRLARIDDEYVVYQNGNEVYRGGTDPSLTVYPYVYDNPGVHHDRLEFYAKPPIYTPEWIANNGSNRIASNVLRRGEDGFMEYDYNGEVRLYFGFNKSKSVTYSNSAARLYYRTSDNKMFMYRNGTNVGFMNVSLVAGEKIRIERKGSMLIFSFGGLEKRFEIDGNIDWHPSIYEYLSGQKERIYVTFDTKGGVCQDYFNSLPSYVNVNPDTYYPPSPIAEDWNLTHTKVYDGEGEGPCHVISEVRAYSDELGRSVQRQEKDYLRNKVWASQTVYDYLGRPALSSLPAPTGSDILQFKQKFIRDALGNDYGVDDFDRTYNANGTIAINKTDSPDPVLVFPNTLGGWYSGSNTEEPWQAITQYPYTRTEFSELTGSPRRQAGQGNAYRMGNGQESSTYTMRTGNELRYVIGLKKPLCLLAGTAYDDGGFLSTTCSGAGTVYNSKYTKSITVDADGKEMIMFYDEVGNEIAKALSGKVNNANVQLQNTTLGIPLGQFRDFHVTDADNTISVWNSGSPPTPYDVYDLATDQKIVSNSTAHPLTLAPGFYRFVPLAGYLTINYDLNYYNFSLNIYDKRNQLIATVAPNDVVYNSSVSQHSAYSFYRYNSLGELIWSETPDAGRTHFFYRNDGHLRFSQNPQQSLESTYSYVKYDAQGRVIETGENQNAPSIGILQSSVDIDDFPTDTGNNNLDKNTTTYDISDPSLPATRPQQLVSGVVSKISNQDGTTWYSYNQEGQASWVGTSISGLPGIKFTDYKYDLLGNIVEVIYQDGQTDAFRHHYTYDDNSQLRSASTRTDDNMNTVPKLHAQYEYSLSGELRTLRLAEGLEQLDYVYTLSGNLKAINPEDMASADIYSHARTFSMALDYYPDDYVAANGERAGNISGFFDGSSPQAEENYTSRIAAQRWKARTEIGGTDFSGYFAYAYGYNLRNQFIDGRFGRVNPMGSSTYDGVFSGMNDYSVIVFGSEYDDNGNIDALLRFGPGGVLFDYFYYHYDKTGGKNRLTRIQDFAGNGSFGDLVSQGSNNYTYDAIGQLTDDVSENNELVYDAYGKVVEVREKTTNNLKATFVYGPDGERVKKLSYNASGGLNKTSWYIQTSGVSSLYEQNSGGNIEHIESAIMGATHLGTAFNAAGNYSFQYELKDHLGNVRAVIGEGGVGASTAFYYADYYPYGWTMPGRNGGSSRYGYQGEFAEKDEETGWNAFELRMYDGRMARWTSIDPVEEFWSPYVAMGNNPVNLSDPTGGMTDPPNGGHGLQYSDDLFYRVTAMANAGGGAGVEPPGFFSSLGTVYGNVGRGVLYALGITDSPGIDRDAHNRAIHSSAVTLNEFNPIVNGVSGVRGLSSGIDIYSNPIGRWESVWKIGEAAASFTGFGMFGNGGNLTFGKLFQFSAMSRVTAPGMSGFRVLGVKYKKFQGAVDYHNWVMRKGNRAPITEKFWHYHWGTGKTGKHHRQLGTGIKLQELSELRKSWFGFY